MAFQLPNQAMNPANKEPEGRPLRIAYIISAYHKPGMLARLVRHLYDSKDWFYIHYDLRSPATEFNWLNNEFKELRNVSLLERHKCHWGDFGHLSASLKGIGEIAAAGFQCDYSILLTGQDYPIKSVRTIRQRLYESGAKSFMQATPWPIPNWEKGRAIKRLENYHIHFSFPKFLSSMGRPFIHRKISIPLKRKLPGGLRPYFGSAYWCLDRRALKQVYEYVNANPAYVNFFKSCHIPEESFFQTILMNSPLAGEVVTQSLTYVNWRPPWPGILTRSDLPALMESECLVARKFDADSDGEVLDLLDKLE
jgi:hypothetical protein